MTADVPGVVFDCNVFLQALLNEVGPAAACVDLVDGRRVTLFLSPETLAEAADVLYRPSLRRKSPSLTPERARRFLEHAEAAAVILLEVPRVVALERDPKDEKYVNLALAAGARYLVTRDKDLLDLMDEGTPEGKDFRQRFPGLTVLNPVAFLREFSPQGEAPASEGRQPDPPPPQGAP